MKKSEFKKMMKKENKAFKNYYVYEIIIILLTMIMVVGNVFATSKNLIPNNNYNQFNFNYDNCNSNNSYRYKKW